jgi:hypothetical protein
MQSKLNVAEMPAWEGRHVPRISRQVESSKFLLVYKRDKGLAESIQGLCLKSTPPQRKCV